MRNVTLHTTRLLLRELRMTDIEALNEIERDPNVTRYMSFDTQTLEQTRRYIETAIRQQSDDPRPTYDLAIEFRKAEQHAKAESPGKLIGRCGMGIHRPDHREAEMWYELHPAHWGCGYAVEAGTALLAFAFTRLGLHRVWADSDPRNKPSCRVAERMGMTDEGLLRENYYLSGQWCDSAIYAILEHEWPQTNDGQANA